MENDNSENAGDEEDQEGIFTPVNRSKFVLSNFDEYSKNNLIKTN